MYLDSRLPWRFWSKVEVVPTGCWLWCGTRTRLGYGQFSVGPKMVSAHRHAYTNLVAPIPDGAELDHLCRVRDCVNPDHLEPVDHRTNSLRGDGVATPNAAKTHCPQNHPYDEANTYYRARGPAGTERKCKACKMERQRRRRAQQRVLGGAS